MLQLPVKCHAVADAMLKHSVKMLTLARLCLPIALIARFALEDEICLAKVANKHFRIVRR